MDTETKVSLVFVWFGLAFMLATMAHAAYRDNDFDLGPSGPGVSQFSMTTGNLNNEPKEADCD